MTSIDQARRRSTDDILREAMNESGNHDAQRSQAAGKPLHFDAFGGFDVHRQNERTSNGDAARETGRTAAGKAASWILDESVDKAVALAGRSFGLRGAIGTAFQGIGSAAMLYELYSTQVEGANREADNQRTLAASDAGVVGLANALPFDDRFKAVVTRTHPSSSGAAAAMKARLESPEHAADLGALRARADKGIVDAAPVARATAKELAALKSSLDSDLDTARKLRAQGREKEAGGYERAAATLSTRVDEVDRRFLAQFPGARADAAYGLGVQYALHHALRAELGTETLEHFDTIVDAARRRVAMVDPAVVQVRA